MTREEFDKNFDKIADSSAFDETFYEGVRIAQERLIKEYMQSKEWKKYVEEWRNMYTKETKS